MCTEEGIQKALLPIENSLTPVSDQNKGNQHVNGNQTRVTRIEFELASETTGRLQEAAILPDKTLLHSSVMPQMQRPVLVENRLIRFSDKDLEQLESALNSANEPNPILVEMFRKYA